MRWVTETRGLRLPSRLVFAMAVPWAALVAVTFIATFAREVVR